MASTQFRVRSGTELLDAAFQLFKSNYPSLLTIVAIGYLPLMLLSTLLTAVAKSHGYMMGRSGSGGVFYLFATVFTMRALIRTLAGAYLGQSVSIAAAFRQDKNFTLGWTYLSKWILYIIGLVLLVVPGVIAMTLLFVAPAIVVLEGATTGVALKRSAELCNNHKARIFGFIVVILVFYLILWSIASVLIAGARLGTPLHPSTAGLIIRLIIGGLAWPLTPALVVVQYYDARIEKEGYDVELLAQLPNLA